MGVQSRPDEGLPPTEIHDVLRNERRRLVLERLLDREEPVSVRSLAEYVAAAEAGEEPPPRSRRQSVYVSLHQTHLPKLDELDVVAYDDENQRVALDERADEVTVYLEVVPRYGLSRNELYLAVALLGVLLAAAAAIGVPPLATVAPATWALATLAVVAGVAAYYTARQGETLLDRL